MNVIINGTEYPIAYTVEAQSKLAERAGGLDKIKDMIGSHELSHMEVLHIMMEAAERREKVMAKMAGEEYSGPVIPDEEDLNDLILIGEMPEVMKSITLAMREGNKSEVEIKEETGKKRSATRSK